MPKKTEERRPELLGTPDAVVPADRREGDEMGYPNVRIADNGMPYHLNAAGERVEHGTPEGFRRNKDGSLSPVGEVAETQETPPAPEPAPTP